METSVIHKAWQTYRKRKTRIGIFTDFLFLSIVIIAAVPQLRLGVCVYAIRATLTQPRQIDKVIYLPNDSSTLLTANGADTTIHWINTTPTLYNIGSIQSAQSRAEMRSLNRLAEKYADTIRVFFITDDDPKEVLAYINKRKYFALRPLFYEQENEFWASHDFANEMKKSIPTSLLITNKGRVIVKKFGAAKWFGKKVDRIIHEIIENDN